MNRYLSAKSGLRLLAVPAVIGTLALLWLSLFSTAADKSQKVKVKTAKGATTKRAKSTSVRVFREYTRWTRANPQPYMVYSEEAALCAAPDPAERSRRDTRPENPHESKFIRVWVNKIGRKALLEMKTPNFPVGSMIIKEKLVEENSDTPELLTAMIKRERGYDTAGGDWEYAVLLGSPFKVIASGKLENCQNCHIPQKEDGYVFRDYLPQDVADALR